jgi:hypothetical protein
VVKYHCRKLITVNERGFLQTFVLTKAACRDGETQANKDTNQQPST